MTVIAHMKVGGEVELAAHLGSTITDVVRYVNEQTAQVLTGSALPGIKLPTADGGEVLYENVALFTVKGSG